jgi:hypothetical protein
MRIGELRRICDRLLDIHEADLDIDFVYPIPHATQKRTKLGQITSYQVMLDDSGAHRVRVYLNYARGPALAEEEKL